MSASAPPPDLLSRPSNPRELRPDTWIGAGCVAAGLLYLLCTVPMGDATLERRIHELGTDLLVAEPPAVAAPVVTPPVAEPRSAQTPFVGPPVPPDLALRQAAEARKAEPARPATPARRRRPHR